VKLEINPKVVVHSGDVVAIDLETNGLNPLVNNILAISICTRDNHYVLDTSKYTKSYITNLLQDLDTYEAVIAHNAKFDASFLYTHYGLDLRNWHCTMLGQQILFNGKQVGIGLVDVLWDTLGIKLAETSHKRLMQHSFIGKPEGAKLTEAQLQYAAADTRYLIQLYEWQLNRAKRLSLERIFALEGRLLPVIVKMEIKGCKIDSEAWLKVVKGWEAKKDEAVRKLDEELERLAETHKQLRSRFYTGKRNKFVNTQFDIFGGADTEVC
jgi:DNA polymerase-1